MSLTAIINGDWDTSYFVRPNGTRTYFKNQSFGGNRITNIRQGNPNTNDIVRLDQLKSTVPVGAIVPFALEYVPSDYLYCNGAYYSSYTYSKLFNIIGYTYGRSGSNFRVPDTRGYFLRGWSSSSGVDPDRNTRLNLSGKVIGNVLGSYQYHALKAHNHSISTSSNGRHGHSKGPAISIKDNRIGDGALRTPISNEKADKGGSQYTNAHGINWNHNHGTIGIYSRGGSETRPPNVYVIFGIKY